MRFGNGQYRKLVRLIRKINLASLEFGGRSRQGRTRAPASDEVSGVGGGSGGRGGGRRGLLAPIFQGKLRICEIKEVAGGSAAGKSG